MPCIAENPAAVVAAANHAPRPRKEAVLPQICAAALAGRSCRQLAATFGLTKSTVSRWLQELREDCPTRVAGSAEIIAHAVARYDGLYRKALAAWDCPRRTSRPSRSRRSRRPAVRRRKGPSARKVRRATRSSWPRPAAPWMGSPASWPGLRRGRARLVSQFQTARRSVTSACCPTATSTTPTENAHRAIDITAEGDEYVAVPRRPGKAETPGPRTSHRARWRASRRSMGSDAPRNGNPPFSAGFSAWRTRPIVEMSALIRGVTPRHNWKSASSVPLRSPSPAPGDARHGPESTPREAN